MDRHTMATSYISSCKKQFVYYKQLAEKAAAQLTDEMFFSTSTTLNPSLEHNSIAVIYKHISGNMKSRWTDFYTTDGEKEWRDRDNEFIDQDWTREQVVSYWEESWELLFSVINNLDEDKLVRDNLHQKHGTYCCRSIKSSDVSLRLPYRSNRFTCKTMERGMSGQVLVFQETRLNVIMTQSFQSPKGMYILPMIYK